MTLEEMVEIKKACEAEFAPEWLGYNARQVVWHLALDHGEAAGEDSVRYHYDAFLGVARAVMHDQARDRVEYIRADRIAELEAENERLFEQGRLKGWSEAHERCKRQGCGLL